MNYYYSLLLTVVLLDGGRGVDHLIAPACAALGYAFHGGQIPLEERGDKEEVGEEEKGSKSKVRKIDSGLTKNGLISKLKSIFNSDKDIRVSLPGTTYICYHIFNEDSFSFVYTVYH